ncbi:hypothetical protein NIES2109_26940 [Nostoc sp. HK-01]|uniref:Uncharacterized protein n=1 Tax=Anabaenopsis circularis NIES-21 TaxID=1085406 RepID=A0A1Z4GEW6_9CYAN|nr:hypothetical protein NIES21_18520 [Anabaenopsis circularis NIES-21]BBD59903.1 hypothetical protein NIES2109_26940 [Nostoc sp. HK-01]
MLAFEESEPLMFGGRVDGVIVIRNYLPTLNPNHTRIPQLQVAKMQLRNNLKQSSTRNCPTTKRMTISFRIIRPEELF